MVDDTGAAGVEILERQQELSRVEPDQLFRQHRRLLPTVSWETFKESASQYVYDIQKPKMRLFRICTAEGAPVLDKITEGAVSTILHDHVSCKSTQSTYTST